MDLIIKNGRLADRLGDGPLDIAVADGRIAAIGHGIAAEAAETYDAGGRLVCGGLIVLSYPVSNAWLAVLLISAGSFFASFAGPCAYTAAIDLGGKHVSMVFSLMNMMGNIGAFVLPIVVPRLVGKDETTGGGNWTLVLFLFAGVHLLAALCWLLADTRVPVGERP